MRTTPNQLFAELEAIQKGHLFLQKGNFFRGAFSRAINEKVVRYPLNCCYYNNGGNLKRANQIQVFIIVADRVYDAYQNLNDTESDTWQCVNDIVDIMTNSRRWNKIGRVESAPITKFIDRSADQVTGHMATVNFTLFDRKNLCDLPMMGYNFNEELIATCAPVSITDTDGSMLQIAAGGSFACGPGEPIRITSNNQFITIPAGSEVTLEDIIQAFTQDS